MISSVWVGAWLVCTPALLLAYWVMRRSGVPRLDSALFATPFFTSPLFIGISGGGSAIYLFDLCVPIMLLTVANRWSTFEPSTRRLAGLLLFSTGIVTFGVTLAWANDERARMLYAGASAFRTIGIVSLFALAASTRVDPSRWRAFAEGAPIAAFSWVCIVICGAMLLQYGQIVHSDVFYKWDESATSSREMRDRGVSAAGLFRGSIGIIGVMGVAAFVSTRGSRGFQELVSIAGAIGGVGMILMTGSKTSFAIAILIVGFTLIRAMKGGGIRKLVYIALAGFVASLATAAYLEKLPERMTRAVFGVVSLDSESLAPLDHRTNRWSEALSLAAERPDIVFGVGLERIMGLNLGYYHNEYIGLLMNGGVFAVVPYFLFIILLSRELLSRMSLIRPMLIFAGLSLVAGLLQGMSIAHIVPGIYFVSTASLFALAYGLGLNRAAEYDAVVAEQFDEAYEMMPAMQQYELEYSN
jgi:hypothetical protein